MHRLRLWVIVWLLFTAQQALAEDWSMYLHDAARTAYTPESVALPGTIAWEFVLPGARACTPPVIADGKVFFGSSDHYVYALNAASGELLWKFRTGADVFSVPAVWNGVVVFGSNDRYVYGVDAATGQRKWKIELPSAVASEPCIADGVAYIGSQDHRLLAIEVDSGKTLWTFATGGNIVGAPSVKDGIIYVGSRDHLLYALDQKTGLQKWTTRLSGDILSTVSVHGAAVFGVDPVRGTVRLRTADGQPAFASERFDTFLLPAGDDERVALVEQRALQLMVVQREATSRLAEAPMGDSLADPIAAGDVLILARGEIIYGFSVRQRKFIWRVAAPDVVTALAAANGTLYFATAAPSVGAFASTSTPRPSTANRPPKAIVQVFPQQVYKREPVTFDGSASFDPDGDPIALEWSGDVGVPQREVRGGFITAYTRSGVFEVRLRVTDAHGATSEASALVQVANRPPAAKIVGGTRFAERMVVTLDGRASFDPDGDRLTQFIWWEVLGEQETVTRFFGAGTHLIRLIVWCQVNGVGRDYGTIDIFLPGAASFLRGRPPAPDRNAPGGGQSGQ